MRSPSRRCSSAFRSIRATCSRRRREEQVAAAAEPDVHAHLHREPVAQLERAAGEPDHRGRGPLRADAAAVPPRGARVQVAALEHEHVGACRAAPSSYGEREPHDAAAHDHHVGAGGERPATGRVRGRQGRARVAAARAGSPSSSGSAAGVERRERRRAATGWTRRPGGERRHLGGRRAEPEQLARRRARGSSCPGTGRCRTRCSASPTRGRGGPPANARRTSSTVTSSQAQTNGLSHGPPPRRGGRLGGAAAPAIAPVTSPAAKSPGDAGRAARRRPERERAERRVEGDLRAERAAELGRRRGRRRDGDAVAADAARARQREPPHAAAAEHAPAAASGAPPRPPSPRAREPRAATAPPRARRRAPRRAPPARRRARPGAASEAARRRTRRAGRRPRARAAAASRRRRARCARGARAAGAAAGAVGVSAASGAPPSRHRPSTGVPRRDLAARRGHARRRPRRPVEVRLAGETEAGSGGGRRAAAPLGEQHPPPGRGERLGRGEAGRPGADDERVPALLPTAAGRALRASAAGSGSARGRRAGARPPRRRGSRGWFKVIRWWWSRPRG